MKSAMHRLTYAKIDLSAIRGNIQSLRNFLPTNAEIWAVVKANAYGHGAVEVSRAVRDLVGGFCVSNLDEALELRTAGLTKPILILSGIVPSDAALARDNDLLLTVPSLEWLEKVLAENSSLAGLKVHIAVDSGMNRIGAQTVDEVNQMIQLLDDSSIAFDGIFTHFATADQKESSHFEYQKARFNAVLSALSRRPRLVHSTNSAAAVFHTGQVQDVERYGLLMYGLNPTANHELELPFVARPALSLKSTLTLVKQVLSGSKIGYGATYTAERDIWAGTLAIGYADGWLRDLQGFHVLVDGEFCEIIGRISMDQMTIKLEKPYPIGTTVTLIGRDGDKEITVDDVADYRGSITNEILTSLSDRIPRVYRG